MEGVKGGKGDDGGGGQCGIRYPSDGGIWRRKNERSLSYQRRGNRGLCTRTEGGER